MGLFFIYKSPTEYFSELMMTSYDPDLFGAESNKSSFDILNDVNLYNHTVALIQNVGENIVVIL